MNKATTTAVDPTGNSSSSEERNSLSAGRGRPISLLARLESGTLFLACYILSIGPMYWTWFEAKYLRGSYFVALFYEPLWNLAGLIPPLGKWLNWYVRWWNL